MWKRFRHWRDCYIRGRRLESIINKKTGGNLLMVDTMLKDMAGRGVIRIFTRSVYSGQVWGLFLPCGYIKKN